MNILVTGASGMLGSAFLNTGDEQRRIYATGSSSQLAFNSGEYRAFDLQKNDYKELIDWANPDVIIHCAAMTNGNACAKDPLAAMTVNGIAVKRLLDATDKDVKIIYISTDAVFPSSIHLANEANCTAPESVYGKSKELGEFFLTSSDRNYCIIRTTIVGLNANPSRESFAEWIINSSNNKKPIALFNDVLFNPITIWRLKKEIDEVIIPNDVKGIYHIAGSEECTKHQFGVALLQSLDYSTSEVAASSILDFADRAKRAVDQTLSTKLYETTFDRRLPTLKETIEEIKQKFYEKNKIR